MEETCSTGAGVIRKSSHCLETWPQTRREGEVPPNVSLPTLSFLACRIPLAKANSHLADVGGWVMQSEVSFLGHRAEWGKTEKRTKNEEGGRGVKKEQVS